MLGLDNADWVCNRYAAFTTWFKGPVRETELQNK